MPFSTSGKNTLLGALPSPIWCSLHSADPGDTGTSEISGGSPAYARVSITLAAASGGARYASTHPTWNVYGTVGTPTTIQYVGFWTAQTSGTFLGYCVVNQESITSQTTFSSSVEIFGLV